MMDVHDSTRRAFLLDSGLGLGGLALGALWPRAAFADTSTAAPRARAKNVIYLHMSGAPPQHDTFDCKPKLTELHGTPAPKELFEGKRLAFIKGHPTLLGSPHAFSSVGDQGLLVSDLMPRFRDIAGDVTVIRSMHTDEFNHAPAELFLFTGSNQFGSASLGSWVTYGLGSENENLPGYVVLVSGESDPTGGKSLWGSAFLPSVHQGVRCRSQGDPILYVSNPAGMDRDVRRRSLDALRALNELEHEVSLDPETTARIEQYELAYRMQTSVPEVMDIKREPEALHTRYGSNPEVASFANNCLLARRLVEQGVRFVQLFDWGWDLHGTSKGDDLVTQYPLKCQQTDQAVAALLLDLKERGLLDETLVIWGGEFGRTAMNEKRNGSMFLGRDHHPDCYTIWMAGAGVHKGFVFGATDELGMHVTQDPVSVRDLQATILHLLGLDPFRLHYPFQGLDQRLIGPEGKALVRSELFS
jgi:hypothetical protein